MKPDIMMKDIDYGRALDEMGFCTAPLFSIDEIDRLKVLYQQFAIDSNVSGLIASHSKIGPERNLLLSSAIRDIVMPALENSFKDFDFFIGGFMVKEANTPDELPLHQDWNILDESLYTSYQIWVPLDLSYPANGGMYVLPYSHRFFNNYRSGSYRIPSILLDDNLRPLMTDMVVTPGSGLVFQNSLFHASYPNESNQNRVSVIVSIYQKNAPLSYFHKNTSDNCTDILGITPELFLTTLNVLENGGIMQDPISKRTAPLSLIDNRKITCADLVNKLRDLLHGHERDFEPRQLFILKDKEIERKIQRDGYVVLDFLDDEKVSRLKTAYEKQFNVASTAIGRFTPMEHSSPATKRSIHDFILDTIGAQLNFYFRDYQTPIASYFTKYAMSAGDLSWHTDASLMLNTNLEPHYGIWCPLIDVNENNGAFCLVRGSHKFSHAVVLSGLSWPYSQFESLFDDAKTVLEMKAGQMVLFDMRLIHHATPNNTGEDRIICCARLTHSKSRYYSFTCKDEKEERVTVFQADPDYYLRDDWSGENQSANRTTTVGEIQHPYAHVDFAGIREILEASVPDGQLNG